MMASNAPGKHHRKGITLLELAEMFPDEAASRTWFEDLLWPDGRYCPRCGSTRTHEASHAKSPYRCSDCRSYFSIKTGTLAEGSNLPLRKWAFAIYLEATSLKGISSMKLHRDIGVTQKTAWFMLHRIREAWADEKEPEFEGPVEVDETLVGGKFRNMHGDKRHEARNTPGRKKVIVAGVRDRSSNYVAAEVIKQADSENLHGFIDRHVTSDAFLFTDEAKAYNKSRRRHACVNHSAREYVRDMVHTNGIESFWSMLKRAHKGTFHKFSPKHLQRYINEFCWRHNHRDLDTLDMMGITVSSMVGKRLTYKHLIA